MSQMRPLKRPGTILQFPPYKSKRPAKSLEQLRQRELAWMLFITEGYAANIAHAVAVNCITFTEADQISLKCVLDAIEAESCRLRRMLGSI